MLFANSAFYWSRSPKRFRWCSGILFSQNTWTCPTYFSAPTHAVCGECCWVWGLYGEYWILEAKFSQACKYPFVANVLIGASSFCFLLLQTSNTHKEMMEIFAKSGFVTQEYILTPLQFGVPYSRPRYFCLVNYFSLFLFTLGFVHSAFQISRNLSNWRAVQEGLACNGLLDRGPNAGILCRVHGPYKAHWLCDIPKEAHLGPVCLEDKSVEIYFELFFTKSVHIYFVQSLWYSFYQITLTLVTQ